MESWRLSELCTIDTGTAERLDQRIQRERPEGNPPRLAIGKNGAPKIDIPENYYYLPPAARKKA